MFILCFFFFFKQKTAYEMRFSVWISDVCSSDLERLAARDALVCIISVKADDVTFVVAQRVACFGACQPLVHETFNGHRLSCERARSGERLTDIRCKGIAAVARRFDRSEEHTSELQSLMRISYAVFCLKNKRHQYQRQKQGMIRLHIPTPYLLHTQTLHLLMSHHRLLTHTRYKT